MTMPKTLTLKNDFHNSAVSVRVPPNGLLSEGQAARVYRGLCGISDCTCGGIRGPQDGIPDGFGVDCYTHQDRIEVIAIWKESPDLRGNRDDYIEDASEEWDTPDIE